MSVYGQPVRAEDLGSHIEVMFFVNDVDEKDISDLQSSWEKIDQNWRAASTRRGIQVFPLGRPYETLLICSRRDRSVIRIWASKTGTISITRLAVTQLVCKSTQND
jgi:hypothetical protein